MFCQDPVMSHSLPSAELTGRHVVPLALSWVFYVTRGSGWPLVAVAISKSCREGFAQCDVH